MKKRTILFSLSLFVSVVGFAQNFTHRGDMNIFWGYNRSVFSTSDIRFTGSGYDFTLNDIKAYDRPTDFSFSTYFKPASITIPQYVYRASYFVTDRWALSIGMDHMKYVMPVQSSHISGEINQTGNPFNGQYDHQEIQVTPDFLKFEHTDGLNYLNLLAEYYYEIYSSSSHNFGIVPFAGAGGGMMIPKSNVTLMNGERSDKFHINGFGISVNAGVQFYFYKHFFFRTQVKGGYINMSDILTRPDGASDRASQDFWFGMLDFAFGGQWSL